MSTITELLHEQHEQGNTFRAWGVDRLRIQGEVGAGVRWHATVVREYDSALNLGWTARLWQRGPKLSDVEMLVRIHRADPVAAVEAIEAELRGRGWL